MYRARPWLRLAIIPITAAALTIGTIQTTSAAAPTPGPAITHPDTDHMGSTIRAHEQTGPTGVRPAVAGVPGFDVSHYQGTVNYPATYNAGARFVYAKATEGTSYVDPMFGTNYANSYAAGFYRGAYHFALPDRSSGATQANYFLAHGGGWTADGHTLPPVIDIEYNPYGATCYNLSPAQLTGWLSDFSNTVHTATRRWPVIYSTTNWWTTCTGNTSALSGTDPLWLARYNTTPGTLPAGWPFYTFWQFADAGTFPGDQDTFNGSLDQLRTFALGTDPIVNHYNQIGGPASYLGGASGGEYPIAGGWAQNYANGVIYYSAATGAWAVHGAILSHYLRLGGPGGVLGFPVTDELTTPDGIGRYNHFRNDASIYFTPTTGPWSIHGAIRDHWAALGWERGVLGYPISDETGDPDGIGRHNFFANHGSIYWTPSTGAWSVHGAIQDRWAALGWERGRLGYPTGDEFAVIGGRRNNFQHGYITFNVTTYATKVRYQ